jgi:DNA helicase-2/ATP-dependent DNA helicase PcrA
MSATSTNYNEGQHQAIHHEGSPLLVIAGAGTGKTTMITGRISYLINQGALPEEMIMMTFTNKSAKDMIRRASLVNPAAANVVAGTFHSIALRLLSTFGLSEGFYQSQKVLGDYQMQRMWEKAYQAEFSSEERGTIKKLKLGGISKLKSWYSKTKTGFMDIASILDENQDARNWEAFKQGCLYRVFKAYDRIKYDFNAYDYDDILAQFHLMLDIPSIKAALKASFTHFFVDEYQDTSLLQADILHKLVDGSPNVTVVGDPNQSIYSFLSASVRNILDFQDNFPHTTVVKLNANYRSSQIILDVANTILVNASEAVYNPLVSGLESEGVKPHIHKYGSDRTEAMGVLRDIKAALAAGTPITEIAVLTRMSNTTFTLESELSRAGIKYVKYGGLKLTAKRNIRQFLALVELALDKYNWLAWEALLPMCPLIGAKLTDEIVSNLSFSENWEWDKPPPLSIGSGKRWKAVSKFWDILQPLQNLKAANPHDFLEQVFLVFKPLYHMYWRNASDKERENAMSEDTVDAEYFSDAKEEEEEELDLFNMAYKTEEKRERNSYADLKLKEVQDYVVEMSLTRNEDLRQFLNQFSLDDSLETTTQEETMVVSTIHSAKGLEWDVVFIVGLEEGTLPPGPRRYGTKSSSELIEAYPDIQAVTEVPYIEEEKRLFYVAATRAAKQLHLNYASMRRGEGMKDGRFIKHLLPRPMVSGTVDMGTHLFTYEKMRNDEDNARFRRKRE